MKNEKEIAKILEAIEIEVDKDIKEAKHTEPKPVNAKTPSSKSKKVTTDLEKTFSTIKDKKVVDATTANFTKVKDKSVEKMGKASFAKSSSTSKTVKADKASFDKVKEGTLSDRSNVVDYKNFKKLSEAVKRLEEELTPELQPQLEKAIMEYFKQTKVFDEAKNNFNKAYATTIKTIDTSEADIISIMERAELTSHKVKNILAKYTRGTDGKQSIPYKEVLSLVYEELTPKLKVICDNIKVANTKMTAPTAGNLKVSKVEESIEAKTVRESIEKITGKKVIYMKENVFSGIINWLSDTFAVVFGKNVKKFEYSAVKLTKYLNHGAE